MPESDGARGGEPIDPEEEERMKVVRQALREGRSIDRALGLPSPEQLHQETGQTPSLNFKS